MTPEERLERLRQLLREGVNDLQIPECVAETGDICWANENSTDPGPCPHEDVVVRTCVCYRGWPCEDSECLGQKLYDMLFKEDS